MTELTYATEAEAKMQRRLLINEGQEVSLIAYDGDRGVYVFDVTMKCSGHMGPEKCPNDATQKVMGSNLCDLHANASRKIGGENSRSAYRHMSARYY